MWAGNCYLSKQAFGLIVGINSVTLSPIIHSFMSRFFKSFKFAINGIKYAVKTQLNFKIQLLAVLVAVGAGWYFHISGSEWLAIVLCMGAVLAAELMNTAIETLVDLVSPEFNPKAGMVKDVAAGAVLVIALTALMVALIIFVPKLLSLNVA